MKSRFYNYVIIVIKFFVSFGKASAQIDKKIVPFRSFFCETDKQQVTGRP